MAIDTKLPKFATWFYVNQFMPERAVTSNLISPLMLLVFRLVCSLYATASVIENLTAVKGLFFAYFTNLSYCGLAGYFWAMTYHSYKYYKTGKADSILLQHWMLTLTLWLLYATVIAYPIEILTMYWSQLFPGSFTSARETYREISVHALNFVMVLLEMCLNRMQLHKRLVVAPLVFISLYMSLTWVIDGIFGFWVYEFMRLAPRVLWIYPCLISFSGLTYFIMYGVNMLKERFLKEEAVSYGSPAPAEESGPDKS
ncbi:hypothetical protein BGZ59_001086 [Podila verticillata]|nr:hypothetical protein BGZ59_001086 [Podila verticillata]